MNARSKPLAPTLAGQLSGWVYPPTIDYARQFHQIYEQPIATSPCIPSFDQRKLRVKLILEELEEFAISSHIESPAVIEAFQQLNCSIDRVPRNEGETANIIYAADALGDLDYVVAGGNLVWGIPAERVMAEIHRSNLSKLGADGRPIKREDGKVIKGPGFFEPNLKKVIYGEI